MQLTSASAISENWIFVDSSSPQVHYVNSAPVLEVSSHLPDDTFKEDVSIKVKVQNDVRS